MKRFKKLGPDVNAAPAGSRSAPANSPRRSGSAKRSEKPRKNPRETDRNVTRKAWVS